MVEPGTEWDGWIKPLDRLQAALKRADERQVAGVENRKAERVRSKLRHFKAIYDDIKEKYPALARGDRHLELSDAEVQELIQVTCATDSGQVIQDKRRYLFQVLSRGAKELDWRLSVPAPMIPVQTASSLFTPEMAARLDDYDALNDGFMESVCKTPDPDHLCIEHDAGELLFSLVMHSGVLSRKWFHQLSSSIRAGVGVYEDLSWLELELSDSPSQQQKKDQPRRRIFLAPLTRLLLRRWYLRWGNEWPDLNVDGRKSSDEHLLDRYVVKLLDVTKTTLHGTTNVFAMAEANLVTIAPGFLVHYARTPDLGRSVPLPNWLRLVTGQIVKPAPSDTKENDFVSAQVNAARIHGQEFPLEDQFAPFKDLLHALRLFERQLEKIAEKPMKPGVGKGVKELIDARGNASKAVLKIASKRTTSVILQLICYYALSLIRQENVPLKELREKIRNVHCLKPLLDYATEVHSETSLDTDEWQAMYETIIDGHRGNDSHLQGVLHGWHEFLHEFYGVERVPLDGGPGYGVDASILTAREYLQAKRHLMSQVDNEFANIQLVLLILGYRCGLRRSEVWTRQLGDFHGVDNSGIEEPELLVRPNKFAGVKSDSAIRKLPLKLLLTEDERSWLAVFLRDRKQRQHRNDLRMPLLADPVSGHFRVTEKEAFESLTSLLRSVTGNPDFRFHHLRHSFATITLFRLLERTPFEVLPIIWCQGDESDSVPGNCHIPFWKQAGLGDPCRGLALLSQWMGHSSERVTLKSYTHLIDFLMGWFVGNRQNPRLTIAQQITLLDKTPSALERFRNRKGLADRRTSASRLANTVGWPAKGLRALPRLTEVPDQLPCVDLTKRNTEVNPLLPYRLELKRVIRQKAPHNETKDVALERAAAQLDIELSLARQWHQRAYALMNYETARDGERGRFSLAQKRNTEAVTVSQFFSLVFRAPELDTFPVPPQSKNAFVETMKLFKRLWVWVSEDSETATAALSAVAKSIQRSHPEIRPRGPENQILYMRFLKALRLTPYFTVEVRALEKNKEQALKNWSRQLGVTKRSISLKVVEDQNIPPDGNLTIRRKSSYGFGHYFWSSLRFVVFTGCVIYDALPDDAREKLRTCDKERASVDKSHGGGKETQRWFD